MLKHTLTVVEAVNNQACPGLAVWPPRKPDAPPGPAPPGKGTGGKIGALATSGDKTQWLSNCRVLLLRKKKKNRLSVPHSSLQRESAAGGKIPATSPAHSRWHQHLVKVTAMLFLLVAGRRYWLLS